MNNTITIQNSQVNVYISSIPSADNVEIDGMATAHIKQLLREKYTPKKRDNMHLADAYQLSGMDNAPNKAVRLATCARWLEFAIPPEGDDSSYKITKTSSCHVRLCPVCQWRRSLNTFRNLAAIYTDAGLKQYKHVFVTLTQKNALPENLKEEIDRISKAFTTMMRKKPFKDIVKGYTRTIEVTIGRDGTFHPHIHAIWTVTPSYGHKEYIRQKDLCNEWGKVLNVDYIPICDIRILKGNTAKAILEVAKYSVKPSEYIRPTLEETADLIKILDPALDGKRFVSTGGRIREIKQQIFKSENIEDIEETPPVWEDWERVLYEWHFADQEYHRRQPQDSPAAGSSSPKGRKKPAAL